MHKAFIITDDMVEAARFTLSSICGFEITAQTARKSLESAQRVAPAPAPNAVCRAALMPFATDADIYDDQGIDVGEKSFKDNITVGDLRRARSALLGPPAPAENLWVTDEMIEAACAAHWVEPWPGDRSQPALKSARINMRAALEAALAASEDSDDV